MSLKDLVQEAYSLSIDLDDAAEKMAAMAARRREIMLAMCTEHKMTVTAVAQELGLSVGRVSMLLRAHKQKQEQA